jgi:polysaccharide biosynthesis protein PslG
MVLGRVPRALLLSVLVLVGWSLPVAAQSPYGINAHAPQGSELAPLLDAAREARIGWVRIDVLWRWVEPSPGVYDFSVYDALVAAAQARGLSLYGSLGSTPAWATDGPPETGVPRSASDWSRICSLLATRYAGKIQAWGLWNEPNLTQFWSGTRQQYIDVVLKPGADAIHAASPTALVVGPELAHLSGNGAVWYRWLTDVLTQAGSKIDVISHHAYDDTSTAVSAKLDAVTYFGAAPQYWDLVKPSVKEVLVAGGWFGRPFWLTETGWASDVVTEAQQASHYSGLLHDWFTGQPGRDWLSRVFFYELKDDWTGLYPKWGILRPDETRKPSFAAYRDFIAAHLGGDVNGDGRVTVEDVFHLVNALYANGAAPKGKADANGDGKTDVADVFYLIAYIFSQGPAPK